MAKTSSKKFANIIPISDKIRKLDKLIVKRSVEKSSEYDLEIKELQSDIDYFYYGVKS